MKRAHYRSEPQIWIARLTVEFQQREQMTDANTRGAKKTDELLVRLSALLQARLAAQNPAGHRRFWRQQAQLRPCPLPAQPRRWKSLQKLPRALSRPT
jgi:hypothetical protein